ncbi:hypothetical protein COI_0185 [Mannheimia haemolytica serotype A2 str. OVINE]|nr:hypothetical protein COI_0185 [Mannheimia haemolytica serotype A2 str. OVINE]EEY11549.1 hypothetical protein COK_2383 [Mannheimia haemolytica serotype A2 str. BOVINE]
MVNDTTLPSLPSFPSFGVTVKPLLFTTVFGASAFIEPSSLYSTKFAVARSFKSRFN